MAESENKIEKWLRSFAKRRREECGQSKFEMPPFTRSLLQREVAKRTEQPEPERNFIKAIFATFGPRLAFAASILIVAAVGVVTWLSVTAPEKSELARTSEESFPALAQAPSPAFEDARQADLSKRKQFDGRETLDLPTETASSSLEAEKMNKPSGLAAETRADAKVPSSAAAPASSADTLATKSVLAMKQPRDEVALAGGDSPGALAAKQTAASNIGWFVQLPLETNQGGRFARLDQEYKKEAAAQNYRLQTGEKLGAQITPSPVLNSFQIVQQGDALQVIDEDGSVYSGQIVPGSETATFGTSNAQRELQKAPPAQKQDAQAFFASGTNRTLNIAVTLNGRIFNQAQALEPPIDKTLSVTRTLAKPAPGQVGSRISGNAQVGGEEIKIEATQVFP